MTCPLRVSRYDLSTAEPPVMIMVVNAAPTRVPATPKREVAAAAPAEASPAASIWLTLIAGVFASTA